MEKVARASIFLLVFVLLSGCVSAPSPEIDYPPGINQSGVTDSAKLISAHSSALENQSYTINLTHVEKYEDGSLRISVKETTYRGSRPNHFYFDYYADEPATTLGGANGTWVRTWSNGSVSATAFRLTESHSVQYSCGTVPVVMKQYSDLDNFYLFVSLLDTTVTRLAGDVPQYQIQAQAETGPTAIGELTDQLDRSEIEAVQDISFTALVTQEGRIERFEAAYTVISNEGRIRVTERVEYTNVGNTTVPKPRWTIAFLRNNAC